MFNVKRGESLVASLFYIDKSIVLSLFGYLKQQLQHETLNAYNSGSRRARAILTTDLEPHTSHAEWHADVECRCPLNMNESKTVSYSKI